MRDRLTREAEMVGPAGLHRRLTEVDPASAAKIHANDLRRIIRALEVFELTGKPISQWQQQWNQESGARNQESGIRSQESGVRGQGSANSLPPDPCALTPAPSPVLWLDWPRQVLYERIDRRVDEMFQAGLVDEARGLRSLEKPLSREASQTLGYKEVFAFLEGRAGLEETIGEVKRRSRQFAKRQITWFRHIPGCQPCTTELTRTHWQSKMKGSPLNLFEL